MDVSDVVDIVCGASKPLFATDFDGTLSDIVRRPGDAQLVPGGREALEALVSTGVELAVVSGRPISFLEDVIPSSLAATLVGQSGLEMSHQGSYSAHPDVEPALPALEAALEDARVRAGELEVESKGFSFTIHSRGRPDLAGAASHLAGELAERHGLDLVPGKMSVEVRVPVQVDKGRAVRSLVADHDLVMYAGDDIVDVSAFLQLKDLEGRQSLSFGVSGPETPSEIDAVADLTVASPAELVRLLRRLAGERNQRIEASRST